EAGASAGFERGASAALSAPGALSSPTQPAVTAVRPRRARAKKVFVVVVMMTSRYATVMPATRHRKKRDFRDATPGGGSVQQGRNAWRNALRVSCSAMCAMPSFPSLAEGQVLAGGRYRVEKVLGKGGMGFVVAAHHLHLDERVALKFIL